MTLVQATLVINDNFFIYFIFTIFKIKTATGKIQIEKQRPLY
jgi:hypothetical protein